MAIRLWEEHFYGDGRVRIPPTGAIRIPGCSRKELYPIPIVTRNIDDSVEYVGNVYDKAGWVIQMLREQMGDEAFFRALKHYLETNRLQNVVSADLAKAIEESSGTNVDQFFDQWIYGAGAPRFTVRSSYDEAQKKVSLNVKQTQKVEGHVGLFHVPIEVSITTSSGEKLFPDRSLQRRRDIFFPGRWGAADGALRQRRQNSEIRGFSEVSGGMDSPVENRARKCRTARTRRSRWAIFAITMPWSTRWATRPSTINSGACAKKLCARSGASIHSLRESRCWPRFPTSSPGCAWWPSSNLGNIRSDEEIAKRLQSIYKDDKAYSVRGAALQSLALGQAPNAECHARKSAHGTSSPEDVIAKRCAYAPWARWATIPSVPALLEWSSPGKPTRLARRGHRIARARRFEKS